VVYLLLLNNFFCVEFIVTHEDARLDMQCVLPHIFSPQTPILANSLIEAIVSDISTAIQVVLFILTLLWIFAYVIQSERRQTRNVLVTAHHRWFLQASKGTDHWTGTLNPGVSTQKSGNVCRIFQKGRKLGELSDV
jgi:hypothetical protein